MLERRKKPFQNMLRAGAMALSGVLGISDGADAKQHSDTYATQAKLLYFQSTAISKAIADALQYETDPDVQWSANIKEFRDLSESLDFQQTQIHILTVLRYMSKQGVSTIEDFERIRSTYKNKHTQKNEDLHPEAVTLLDRYFEIPLEAQELIMAAIERLDDFYKHFDKNREGWNEVDSSELVDVLKDINHVLKSRRVFEAAMFRVYIKKFEHLSK